MVCVLIYVGMLYFNMDKDNKDKLFKIKKNIKINIVVKRFCFDILVSIVIDIIFYDNL